MSPQQNQKKKVNHHINTAKNKKVFLRMAPVELSGPEGKVDKYAFSDEAPTITMIDAKRADDIGATGYFEALKL
ncbi:hypothetical protein JTB14_028111 [Gonioctena quinquepunctata]|nr:hypothetical protein JTB14_028111 [Gonioctena quinquepunctata]